MTPAEPTPISAAKAKRHADADAALFSDLHASLDGIGKERDWFARGAIEGFPMVVFAGAEKSGKSWTAMQLCVATALGGAWLGQFKIEHPGECFYLDTEYGEHEFTRRVARIARAEGYDPREVLDRVRHVWSADLQLHPDNVLLGMILRAAARRRPVLVVGDPWRNVIAGEENSAPDTIASLAMLAKFRDDAGSVTFLPHHLNRAGTMSGSRALKGRADLFVEGSDDEVPFYTAIGRTIRRGDPISKRFTIDVTHIDDEDDTIAKTLVRARFEGEDVGAELSKGALRVRVLLTKAGAAVTVRAIRNELRMSNPAARAALEELRMRAIAACDAKGRWSIATSEFFRSIEGSASSAGPDGNDTGIVF
jgi:hypothetical protein